MPNSFTPATTILSSEMNANFVDIATALSSVLTRDNQAPMTAPLRLADGSEALPGLQFASDTNTGIRRSGADVMEFVTGGADRAFIDAAGKLWALFAFDVAGAANFQSTLGVTGAASVQSTLSALATIELGHANDTTLARSGAGDMTIEGNAVYRAGGTDVPIADGGTGASTAAAGFSNLKQAASDSATGVIEIAVQSEMETPASALLAVTPARQQFHPGHPKAGGNLNGSGTPAFMAGDYGMGAVTDNGVGDYIVALDTAFSNTNYWCAGYGRNTDVVGSTSTGVMSSGSDGAKTASTFQVKGFQVGGGSLGANADLTEIGMSFWGDYA